jgi:S-adenosylmethionine:tRNA ribosyltransferase-isomerase
LNVDLFDFDLPTDNIALRPAAPRDAARMLVLEGDRTLDADVSDLPSLLRRGDMLVFNDTRVIPAQLDGRRADLRIAAMRRSARRCTSARDRGAGARSSATQGGCAMAT